MSQDIQVQSVMNDTGHMRYGQVSMALKVFCLAGLFCQLVVPSYGQKVPDKIGHGYRAIYWGLEDGLSGAEVWRVLNDVDGFLWLGSAGRLSRFDGSIFKNYYGDRKTKGSIDATISYQGLVEDSLHNIWIGTNNGLYRYDRIADTFMHFSRQYPILASNHEVFCWESNSIVAFNQVDFSKRKVLVVDANDSLSIPGLPTAHLDTTNNVIWALRGRQGPDGVWKGSGLLAISLTTGESLKYDWTCFKNIPGHNHSAEAMVYDPGRNCLWVNSGEGLMKFTLDDRKFHYIGAVNSFFDDEDYDRWVGICLDLQGRVWLATVLKGIVIFDPSDNTVTFPFPEGSDDQEAISKANYVLHCDREGSIWSGYWLPKGLYQIAPYAPVYDHYDTDPENSSILGNCLNMTMAGNGRMWLGTTDLIRRVFDAKTGTIAEWPADIFPSSLRNTTFLPIRMDTLNNVAALYCFQGLIHDPSPEIITVDLNSHEIDTLVFLNSSGEEVDVPYYFGNFTSQDGNFCSGVLDNRQSVFLVDRNMQKKITELFSFPLTSNHSYRLTCANDNYIFFKGPMGGDNLTFINENGKWSVTGIPLDTMVWHTLIYHEQAKEYWVSTGGTIVRCNQNFEVMRVYSHADGLPEWGVDEMIIDSKGNLWFHTDRSIHQLNVNTGAISTLSERDGFQTKTSIGVGMQNGPFGDIYIAGSYDAFGFSLIRPDRLTAPTSTVYFRSLEIDHSDFSLPTGLNHLQELNLQYFQNKITIETGVIDFSARGTNRIRYRLTSNNPWEFSPANYTIRLDGLSPGVYNLELQAANAINEFSGPVKKLRINISPPWWRTFWANLIYILLFLGLLYSFYNFMLRRRLTRLEMQRLQEMDAFKTRLYTNITHEFRTPLTIILGMADQLTSQVSSSAREGLQMISRSGRNLLRLVNQMLDLQKLESGNLAVNMIQGDILLHLKYICDSFQSFGKEKDIRIHFLSEHKEIVMDYDEEKTLQIVSNLLSNAIKFSRKDSDVFIIIHKQRKRDGDFLTLIFRDSGIGISPEDIPHIFDRFYQSDHELSRKGVGTGIGLALTKELTKLLGGTIEVESEPGKGSQFRVSLPISHHASPYREKSLDQNHLDLWGQDEREATSIRSGESPEISNLPLLLIIEDQTDVQRYLRSCLETDYELLIAQDGVEGIEKAIEYIPDIIVSDVMMPRRDGFEVCHTLKNDVRTSHVPIILLTAKADFESKISGLSQGADAYLLKPFNLQELQVRCRKLIELRQRLHKIYSSPDFIVSAKNDDQDLENQFLTRLRHFLLENLSDPDYGITEICNEMHISRIQLHRKLKALTGKSASHHIRSIRLHEAYRLLEQSQLNMSEIAYEVGFSSPAYFSTTFLNEFGVSPSDIRKGSS